GMRARAAEGPMPASCQLNDRLPDAAGLEVRGACATRRLEFGLSWSESVMSETGFRAAICWLRLTWSVLRTSETGFWVAICCLRLTRSVLRTSETGLGAWTLVGVWEMR